MSKIGILVSPERFVTTSGDGSVTERFETRNRDGSTSVFSVSHHKGCAGEWPCGCDPIKTNDRYYPWYRRRFIWRTFGELVLQFVLGALMFLLLDNVPRGARALEGFGLPPAAFWTAFAGAVAVGMTCMALAWYALLRRDRRRRESE